MSKLIYLGHGDDIFSTYGDLYPEFEKVQQVLEALGVPNTIAAGGYFRDKQNGKPWKDIDLFIPGNVPLTMDRIEYDLSSAITATIAGYEVNIIQLKQEHTFQSTLERMDIGLCQIGFYGGGIYCTQAYMDDVANKTITVFSGNVQGADDNGHLDRVKAKYPDFTVVNK